MADIILEVKNLKKYFDTPMGLLHAVDDVSFTIERGKTLGIVGESGCGKSTTGRVILKLIEPTDGEIIFEGQDITFLRPASMRRFRNEMQIIFQDPFSSLDPKRTVGQSISDAIRKAGKIKDKKAIDEEVFSLMETVGLAERLINAYPHELDGGRRQRIGIARALAMNPKFIVCDEPVSALDVSIQAQILNLLEDMQEQYGLTYIFITHDLSVVNHIADDIAVMYLGQVVEKAPTEELFSYPVHPYTEALLSAVPVPDLDNRVERIIIKGEITSPIDPPNECRFVKRCPYAIKECHNAAPSLNEIVPGHFVACYLAESRYRDGVGTLDEAREETKANA